jgi:transposase
MPTTPPIPWSRRGRRRQRAIHRLAAGKDQGKNPDKCRIYIYSDNVRYYRSRLLKAYLAENPWFVLLHLPPYSSNLNLIERLWKFLRKKVINSYCYEKFDDFKNAVMGFFKNIEIYFYELESLLTLKFQLFGK